VVHILRRSTLSIVIVCRRNTLHIHMAHAPGAGAETVAAVGSGLEEAKAHADGNMDCSGYRLDNYCLNNCCRNPTRKSNKYGLLGSGRHGWY